MSNTRTAIMFMDKAYPDKVGGGSGGTEVIPNPSEEPTAVLETIQIEDTVYNIPGEGSSSKIEPNPQGIPTDTLTTIGIDGTIYDIVSGGEPTKTLVYELGAGGQWELFANPHSSKKLLVEAVAYSIINSKEFEPTLLPAREGGDNYVWACNTPVGKLDVNLGQIGNGETIYIRQW